MKKFGNSYLFEWFQDFGLYFLSSFLSRKWPCDSFYCFLHIELCFMAQQIVLVDDGMYEFFFSF